MRVANPSPSRLVLVRETQELNGQHGRVQIQFDARLVGAVCSTGGNAYCSSNAETRPMTCGSALIVVDSTPLHLAFHTGGDVTLLAIARDASIGRLHERLFPRLELVRFSNDPSGERFRSLVKLAAAASRATSPAESCLLEAFLFSLAEQRQNGAQETIVDSAIRQALEIVQRELSCKLNVAALAKRVGLSRAAFVRRFATAVGLPPEKYQTWLRMRHARQLLATTDASLAEIGAAVGYGSEFSFSRAFHRWQGVRPGSYRQQARHGSTVRALAA